MCETGILCLNKRIRFKHHTPIISLLFYFILFYVMIKWISGPYLLIILKKRGRILFNINNGQAESGIFAQK